jgi:hypothetical protein
MRYKFFMISTSDANTAITGITPSVQLSVNGGSFAASTNSAVEVGLGEYYVELTDAELGTAGPVGLVITGTGAVTWRDVLRQSHYFDSLLSQNTIVGSAGYTLAKLNQFATLTEVNLLSIIVGATITVNRHDSWEIPIPDLPDLTGYTSILFSVKDSDATDDLLAQLIVRSDTGLVTIGKQAPTLAANGTLTIGTEAITVDIDIDETEKAEDGNYTWWIKGFNSGGGTGTTIATGDFVITTSGAKVTS